MYIKYLSLFLILMLLASCKQKNQSTENPQTTIHLEEINELPDSLMNDTLTFDIQFYNYLFFNELYEVIAHHELQTFQTEKFRIYNDSELYKIDGAEQDNYKSYFIIEKTGNKTYAHLVNYKPDMQYIDSRVVFYATEDRMYDNVYSKIDFNKAEVYIMDQATMLENHKGILTKIDKNGKYLDLADYDIPLIKDTIAMSSCMGGLYGKFPVGEKWTLISFMRNKIGIAETTRHYLDHVENVTTLLDIDAFKGDDVFYFDIAYKGEYSKDDIQILSLTEEKQYSKQEMMTMIMQQTDTIPYFNYEQNYIWDVFKVHSFIHNEGEYKLVTYTYNIDDPTSSNYPVLLGITPDEQVVWLARSCADEFYLFSFNNEIILYIYNSSCGEGAMGNIQLFRINEGFERFYQESIGCD